MKPRTLRLRRWLLALLTVTILTVFIAKLMQIQIVDAHIYQNMLNAKYLSTQTIKAVRGEIVDRDGQLLAGNRMGYDVQIDRATFPSTRAEQNEVLYRLTALFGSLGESWDDILPLTDTAPFAFLEGQENRVATLKSQLKLQSYATAEHVMIALQDKYRLHDYSPADARMLAGICYEMEQRDFGLRIPYTFATDLDITSVIQIRERSYELPGVEVVESAVRIYEDGELAPHVIGTIGAIYAEEYQQLKKEGRIFQEGAEVFDTQGYMMDDIIGKEGVERSFEQYLRGHNGRKDIYVDASNTVVEVSESISPIPGNTVVLTLDRNLQKTASEALEAQIRFLNENTAPGRGQEADTGAVAVVNVKTGEILALATYPSYDLATYRQDYAQLAQDPEGLKPLFNRAVMGEYTPGSIFKPAVAVAGLSNGVITPSTTFSCTGVRMIGNTRFTCLSAHGGMNLLWALHYSCNTFFYDTGSLTGIDLVNDAAAQLGLGEPTGIEIAEAPGQRSIPALKEQQTGEPWSQGDVLQSSIGQMLNKYTPLQLANYAATIANKGRRMDLTLVHEIRDYSMQKVVEPSSPKVAHVMDVGEDVFDAVTAGMVSASRTGTAAGYFGNYPLTIASKTGTPETADLCNSTFIAFGPVEDPEIAVAVVIEKGWHGFTSAPVAKAIFDEYYGIEVNAPNRNGWDQLRAQRAQEAEQAAVERQIQPDGEQAADDGARETLEESEGGEESALQDGENGPQ